MRCVLPCVRQTRRGSIVTVRGAGRALLAAESSAPEARCRRSPLEHAPARVARARSRHRRTLIAAPSALSLGRGGRGRQRAAGAVRALDGSGGSGVQARSGAANARSRRGLGGRLGSGDAPRATLPQRSRARRSAAPGRAARCHAATPALWAHSPIRHNSGRRAGALPGRRALCPPCLPRHASCQPPRQRPTLHGGIGAASPLGAVVQRAASSAQSRADVAACRVHRRRGTTTAARRRGTASSQALCCAGKLRAAGAAASRPSCTAVSPHGDEVTAR